VKRDREWFAEKLPIMDAFWKRVLWHREHGIEDLEKPKRAPRAKKEKPVPKCCIQELDEDQESDEEMETQVEPSEVWDYAYL
jgi:hypothetical protein